MTNTQLLVMLNAALTPLIGKQIDEDMISAARKIVSDVHMEYAASTRDRLLAAVSNLIGAEIDAAADTEAAIVVEGVASVGVHGIFDGKLAVVAEDMLGNVVTVYVVPGEAVAHCAA